MSRGERFITRLRELTALPGIAGHEEPVSRFMADSLRPFAANVWTDRIGNVIARCGSEQNSRRIAVLAHMDTVGLMVKRVNDDGTLGVIAVGGVNVKALPGTPVRVGDSPGVIGVRSQHLAQAGEPAATVDDLAIQVDPAVVHEIEITTPVTYAPASVELGPLFSAPHLDNRAGCAVLLDVAQQLSERTPASTVYLIGTVQEETTCAGALSALQAVAPDYAIFVDGTVSYDTLDTRRLGGSVRLGGGPVLTAFLYVSGLNGWHADPRLRSRFKAIARSGGIPFQQDAVRGLISDARVATWLGLPSVLIGLPMRGKHGPLETVHLDDLSHGANLIVAALEQGTDYAV